MIMELHTVKISLSKDQCSWCDDRALYEIECSSWVDLACATHREEWFPFKPYYNSGTDDLEDAQWEAEHLHNA